MSTVDEYAAKGDIEEIYFQICHSFRVSGVNLIFRKLAPFEDFFVKMWQEIQPLVESAEFCKASDRIRTESIQLATGLRKNQKSFSPKKQNIGESQAFQIQAALDLYHYINPKLLLMTAHLQFVLAEGQLMQSEGSSSLKRISRGIPARMFPMEMVDEQPKDKLTKEIFEDIQKTLSLKALNSDYRTLALWPEYLSSAWRSIKPVVKSNPFKESSNELKMQARELAVHLPTSALTRSINFDSVKDLKKIKKMVAYFEDILPSLILNISLLQLDWKPTETLKKSPFPEKFQPERNLTL